MLQTAMRQAWLADPIHPCLALILPFSPLAAAHTSRVAQNS